MSLTVRCGQRRSLRAKQTEVGELQGEIARKEALEQALALACILSASGGAHPMCSLHQTVDRDCVWQTAKQNEQKKKVNFFSNYYFVYKLFHKSLINDFCLSLSQ